jgi:hypothetical protein
MGKKGRDVLVHMGSDRQTDRTSSSKVVLVLGLHGGRAAWMHVEKLLGVEVWRVVKLYSSSFSSMAAGALLGGFGDAGCCGRDGDMR